MGHRREVEESPSDRQPCADVSGLLYHWRRKAPTYSSDRNVSMSRTPVRVPVSTCSSISVHVRYRYSSRIVQWCVVLVYLLLMSVSQCVGINTTANTTAPVPTQANDEFHIFAAVIGVLGVLLVAAAVYISIRLVNMWLTYRKAVPVPPQSQAAISRNTRRTGSFRDQQSSGGGSSFRAPSLSGSAGASTGPSDALQGVALQTASRASNWRPVVSSGGSTSGMGTSVSNSGGSSGGGHGSGHSSFNSMQPSLQLNRQTSATARRSIIKLAQEVTARGKTWHTGNPDAAQGNLPGLSNIVGPTMIHQQLDTAHQNGTLSRQGQSSVSVQPALSPFFTPQSPTTLSKMELLSTDRPMALQPVAFGAAEPGVSFHPAPAMDLAVNNYENDIVHISEAGDRRSQLTLPLAQAGAAPVATISEDGDGLPPAIPARSPKYLPMDEATLHPVNQPAAVANGYTTVPGTAPEVNGAPPAAGCASACEILTPADFPNEYAVPDDVHPTSSKYSSYEDMRGPHRARQSSVSSRKNRSSGGTPTGEKSHKNSLANRIGAHFSKSGALMMMLPGRRHHNSSKDLKGENQSPQCATPTFQPGSLATPVDHLRESSIASALSASSLPLPADQQRYVPFPLGNSPHSHSHSLAMQAEASSQDLSP